MFGGLTKAQAELIERLDGGVVKAVAGRAAEYDRTASFPDADFADLHREGLMVATLPKADGGLGFGFQSGDPLSFFLIIERLATASPATAHCYQVHGNASQILRAFGSDAQVRRFAEPSAKRGLPLVGSASEPGGGRHSTTADRVAGGYRVNGVKHYATNATRSEWMTVHIYATDTKRVETLVVHRDAEGLTIDEGFWDPTGMRACVSPLLVFKDCFIPEDCILGHAEDFLSQRWLAKINFGFTANYLGALQGMYGWSVGYLREHGKKDLELYQNHIGEIKTRIDAARLLFYHAALLTQEDLDAGILASNEAKWFAIECINRFIALVGQFAGSTAYFKKYPLERMCRDMLVHTLHRRHHVGAEIVGRAELGLDYDVNKS